MAVVTPSMPRVDEAVLKNSPGGRPDALPIAQAAVRHMRGDLTGALECLSTVPPELETADLLQSRGYIQLEMKDFASAAKSYESATSKEPSSVDNWFQWGFCLHKLGQVDEALKRFEKATELGADWIEVPLAKSICHLALKQYPQAIECADQCIAKDPAYVPALFAKGVVLQVIWELDKACEVYQTLLTHNPKFLWARMNLITAGMQQKNHSAIEHESEALLALEPENVLALEGTALVAFGAGDFEKARQIYSRLTELAPSQAEHWLNLGVALRKLDRTGDSVEAFRKARTVRPESVQAYTHLAEALAKLGNLKESRACYEEALAKWPLREDLALNLSHVLSDLNETELAERVCADYCGRTADRPQVWFRLGYLQWQQQKIAGAVESFSRAVELQPVWPDAEVNLALACFSAGQVERSEQILLALQAREPQHLEALKGLATIALDKREHEKAFDLHLKMLQLGEKTADVYFNCGVLAQHLDRASEAAGYYRQAIEIRPNFAEALLNLGHTLQSAGEADEAKAFFIPALELNPGFALDYFRRR